jgi:DNA-directed RNA polymerase beta' subunit
MSLPSTAFGGVKRIGRKNSQREDIDSQITLKRKPRIPETVFKEQADLPLLKITGINFCNFDQEVLKKLSVVTVTSSDAKGISIVNDPRMGTMGIGDICSTCRGDSTQCPGHLGVLTLAAPILHPLHLRTVVKVLRCVCNTCGELLMSDDLIKSSGVDKFHGADRLSMMEEISKTLPCIHRRNDANTLKCKPNPVFDTGKIKETMKIATIYQESGIKKKDKKEIPTEMPLDKIIKILENISDETAEKMGFTNGAHPRNLILYNLAIVPPCNRPNTYREGKVSQDPLTTKYNDIVKLNNSIAEHIQKEEEQNLIKPGGVLHKKITEDIEKLKRQLTKYILSLMEEKETVGGSKKPKDTIYRKLHGKEGLIRGNLMGKRVNFSGRTVISPDPNLEFGQIRIPLKMAMILTMNKVVNNINYNEIISLWNQGRITTIVQKEGRNKNKLLKYQEVKDEVAPAIGDLIERWLQDGDYVLFNRQPTLHKYSIQAYKVLIGKEDTIGLHPSSTTPHNADFDGDEGNIHVIQDIEAFVELINVTSVKNCLISAQSFKPSSALIFDSLTAGFLLTQDDVYVSEALFFYCLSVLTNKKDLYSLEERCKTYNVIYSKEQDHSDLIKEQEEIKGKKLTKLETDEVLSRATTGRSILKLKDKIDKKKLPEELRKVPAFSEYIIRNLGDQLNFIRNEELRELIKKFFIENSETQLIDDIKINDYIENNYENYITVPERILDTINTLYWKIKQDYFKDWTRGIIPSLKKYLEYFNESDNDKIKELSDKYYREFYVKTTYQPKVYSGKALFSSLFPADFSYQKDKVLITQGILRSGPVVKKHVGVSQNSIVQALSKDYDNQRAMDFITDASFILEKYITERGFSVGIRDCLPKDDNHKKFLQDKLFETFNKAKGLEVVTGSKIDEKIKEIKIMGTLDLSKTIGRDLLSSNLASDNALSVMASSGAKGADVNVSQISGFLSQQYITFDDQAQRFPTTLSGGTRCLPYFTKNSIDPQARGFCVSSFAGGLLPSEVVFHQAASRLGSMDIVIGTRNSGTLRRMMAKALENLRREYDGTIRNSKGRIFSFGDDQLDASKLEIIQVGNENRVFFVNPFRVASRLNSYYGFEISESTTAVLEESNIDIEFDIELDGDFDYE